MICVNASVVMESNTLHANITHYKAKRTRKDAKYREKGEEGAVCSGCESRSPGFLLPGGWEKSCGSWLRESSGIQDYVITGTKRHSAVQKMNKDWGYSSVVRAHRGSYSSLWTDLTLGF